MERVILHSDINSCFASIELLFHPELRELPVAVGGDSEKRHGIILAKNEPAKRQGVKTGSALWQARQACPGLVVLPPHMELYLEYSKKVKKIYSEYTDLQESFGIDEAWLDVTGSARLFGSGEKIAREINRRVKAELGLTVSVGVSWNKIFAKLGSDYKKPDAVTVIDRENFRDIVWPLPVRELLYVGPSVEKKLRGAYINTIGELAAASEDELRLRLGKMGGILHSFANGLDASPVLREDSRAPMKSIGNSTTTPRDLENEEDAWLALNVLAESVGARLRERGLKCRVVELWARDNGLDSFTRRRTLENSSDITRELANAGFELLRNSYDWSKPLRSIGLRASGLVPSDGPVQLSAFEDDGRRERSRALDAAVDGLRERFGQKIVQRALMYTDRTLSSLNAKEENVVQMTSYFSSA